MGEHTKISWADHTFSPWIGCAKVNNGCANCYAEAMAKRLGVMWGPTGTRRRTAESTWKLVRRWNREAGLAAEFHAQYVAEAGPLCARIPPARPRVFPSLCDPFEAWSGLVSCNDRELLLDQVRADFFGLIDSCPNLDFVLLTKRPENVLKMWPVVPGRVYRPEAAELCEFHTMFRPNVWLLYSASDQAGLDRGLPDLRDCRHLVPVAGLSLEPLLGPITGIPETLDWVIVGGESGPRAREMDEWWVVDLVIECNAKALPVWVKQDSGRRQGQQGRLPWAVWRRKEIPTFQI